MDVGNLPIFSGSQNKSRSHDINAPKNPWEEIGDYNQGPATTTTNDDEEEEVEQVVHKSSQKPPTEKEKQESNDAASIASQAAVKESQKNQLQK
jgi:hypothetical protein